MPSEKNERIVTNTLNLYFRMLLTTLVSLFAVRIVLNALGAVDYGIYNVVGGVVLLLSFISNTMSSASQRFLAFELGKNDIVQLKKVFSLTVAVYAVIAVVALLLAETIGLWFLNTYVVMPPSRIAAANWVYQFAALSFIVNMIRMPYTAAIIARENMEIYAYVSVIEALLKLLLVYALVWSPFDKLKLYACLMFAMTCAVTLIYAAVCRRKYEECRFRFYWDKGLFGTFLGYTWWNLFGTLANVANNQGVNILLNIFFGPVVNAARAVAYQLGNAVNQFVTGFHTAVRPPLTKYYAAGEGRQMMHLMFRSSKISFFLLFMLSVPVLLETDYLLALWLKTVPGYAALFTKLVVIAALIDSLSYPLATAAAATGRIKRYQMVVGGILLLNLPASYCFLKSGFPPQTTLYVAIAVSVICLFARLWVLRGLIGLSIENYFKKVIRAILPASVAACVVPVFFIFKMEQGPIRFITVTVIGSMISGAVIYLMGLSADEKRFCVQMIEDRIIRKIKPKG